MTTEVLHFVSEQLGAGLRPNPKINIWQWADEHRVLSSRASHIDGPWSTNLVPFLREPMEMCSPGSGKHRVVVVKPSQIGGTEIILNLVGHRIHLAPCPIILAWPSLADARKHSRHRVGPMISTSAPLRSRVRDPKARDSGNTTLTKEFPGGYVQMVGASSPKGLAGSPAEVAIGDDVDRFPQDVGGEGDPVDLLNERLGSYPDGLLVLISTPTVAGTSRIWREYEASDRRINEVPCPSCNFGQPLTWDRIKCEHDADGHRIPETARFRCSACAKLFEEDRWKYEMVQAGTWRAQNPDQSTVGYHLNALYALHGKRTWAELTRTHQKVKSDPPRLKVFVNTALGECWHDKQRKIEAPGLQARAESYGPKVPRAACLLTAGVDVQEDRVETVVKAWAPDQQSWTLEWRQWFGNTEQPEVWRTVDDYLRRPWEHETGWQLTVSCTCVDSGNQTDVVYRYVKQYRHRHNYRLFATKGHSTPARAIASPVSNKNAQHVPMIMVGTDSAKDVIFARTDIPEPGPGYFHTHQGLPAEYYSQLFSEVKQKRYHEGKLREWYALKSGHRNEVLDCEVLNLVALTTLNPALEVIHQRLLTKTPPAPVQTPARELAKAPARSVRAQRPSNPLYTL